MLKPSAGVSLEGLPHIFFAAFCTVVFAVLEWWFPTVLMLVLTALALNFFRDPERVQPEDAEAVVSPADGKIVKIGRETDPVSGEARQVICVFMNIFDVHVNRMPVSGTIQALHYHPGKFFNASLDKSSKDNERNVVEIVGKGNQRFTVVQIAGLVARRIVCWAEKGDKLKRAERFGLIKFGSRVDLYLPDGYDCTVYVGDQVFAGQTVVAVKR